MLSKYKLKRVYKKYLKMIDKAMVEEQHMTVEFLLQQSLLLYNDIKVAKVSNSGHIENDMLLFQYGCYSFHSNQFSIDITRQFIIPNEDEPYQLQFTLLFDPEDFKDIEPYNCWSMDFETIADFEKHLKETSGYMRALPFSTCKYSIGFEQC